MAAMKEKFKVFQSTREQRGECEVTACSIDLVQGVS